MIEEDYVSFETAKLLKEKGLKKELITVIQLKEFYGLMMFLLIIMLE